MGPNLFGCLDNFLFCFLVCLFFNSMFTSPYCFFFYFRKISLHVSPVLLFSRPLVYIGHVFMPLLPVCLVLFSEQCSSISCLSNSCLFELCVLFSRFLRFCLSILYLCSRFSELCFPGFLSLDWKKTLGNCLTPCAAAAMCPVAQHNSVLRTRNETEMLKLF